MNKTYILITPAKNEEAYIEKTIRSVTSQSILPKKWVIVSDGSTDRTDEIVHKFAKKYGFIQLICIEGRSRHNFKSKINAFKAGYTQLGDMNYEFIGNDSRKICRESQPGYCRWIHNRKTQGTIQKSPQQLRKISCGRDSIISSSVLRGDWWIYSPLQRRRGLGSRNRS
ncbi:MAG: glycosyltransferase [bacterium]